MSRRRGLVAGAVLLAVTLTGCADVAADPGTPTSPSTTPTSTPTSPSTSATPTSTPTSTPTTTPSTTAVTPSAKPTTSPTSKPTVKPPNPPKPPKPPAKPASQALLVERKLDSWGYPVGDVDGEITKRARQALCAYRETAGLPISRGPLTAADIKSVLSATAKPVPTKATGIYVNKTCLVLYQVVKNTYRRIVWVSTGGPGYETPNRTGKVWRKYAGAHESSLYEDAYMYDSLYFLKDRPGIALHGSRVNSLVKTYPASHRCVRVMRPQIHQIFAETPIGTKVQIYGKY
ncbi:L,D-transpeptidase [Kribbella qitaiheensis]|uniref:L,D-transpeptidase n=1 Tax=Kribbella qitaiheensis TaxID=1544730 RepID=UPI001FE81A24|nr:L,D-transpeptidase [Kribbella qitaiheensis]